MKQTMWWVSWITEGVVQDAYFTEKDAAVYFSDKLQEIGIWAHLFECSTFVSAEIAEK